jgi:TonB family protein
MKRFSCVFLGALCLSVVNVRPAAAQERIVVAGQDGVAAPRRTKTVAPSYPQEALAQGVRGIVILEILIDPQGKVKSAEVIRSIPLLDEAALSAVRNWEYEVTKVDGAPVSVRLTVPITFALKVPEVTRAPGIPELRQGANVQFPPGQTTSSSVAAEVTLAPDGQVAKAQVLEGTDPWTAALLSALRTWRFAAEGDNVVLSFRVDADFLARGDKPKVEIRLSELRRSEAIPREAVDATAPATPAAPSEPATAPPAAREPAPATPETATPPSAPTATSPPAPVAPAPPVTTPPTTLATPPADAPTPATPVPTTPPATTPPTTTAPPPTTVPPSTAAPPSSAPAPAPSTPAPPAGPPSPTTPQPGAPTSAEPKPQVPAPPPVEVITAPRPPEAQAPPPQPGVSAIRDVTLALGVPDLVRGRRPVPPPLARMSGTTGSVDVKFSVDAAGVTSVAEVAGPEVLKTAATYTVQSWLFRRVTPQRLYLLAAFDFAGETAKASVRPEEAPSP